MPPPTVLASLGEPLVAVQERSSALLLPEPFQDDDAAFVKGPLQVTYTGVEMPFTLPDAGMLAIRLLGGRVLNLDVNPHLAPLSTSELIPLWDDISARLEKSGGFWLPGELKQFTAELPRIIQGQIGALAAPPWGAYGLIGPDTISFSVRPNGYPSVQSQPVKSWTFRVEVSISNRQVSRNAYEYAQKVRRELGGSPFEPILMRRYPSSR